MVLDDEAGSGTLFIYVVDGNGGFDLLYVEINIEAQEIEAQEINEENSIQNRSVNQDNEGNTIKDDTKQQSVSDTQNNIDTTETDDNNELDSGTVESDPGDTFQQDELRSINKLTTPGQIGFSELMYAITGDIKSDVQWIELYNRSQDVVDLVGWKLVIEERDIDNQHHYTEITLGNLLIAGNGTVIIVTSEGRRSVEISESIIYNLFNKHSEEFGQDGTRSMIIGQNGFFLTLIDPDGSVSDVAGNLDGDRTTQDHPEWELPNGVTEEGLRSSLMRRYTINTNTPRDGKNQIIGCFHSIYL